MRLVYSLVMLAAIFSEKLLACPGCSASMDNPKEIYKVIIIGVFILLTYIPFYFIYSIIIKNRNINSDGHSQNR